MITESKEIFITEYPQLLEILDEHERAHWVVDDIKMQDDIEQWKNGKIPDGEKLFNKMIFRFFTQADKNICDNYISKLFKIFKHPDMQYMLLSFAAREVTHARAYKHLNVTLGYDDEAFMSEFLSFKEMKDKHEYMLEDVDLESKHSQAEYLIKQVLLEGVDLFALFAMLLAPSRQGKLPGMVSVNQWSIADESLHIRGIVEGFKIFVNENPEVVTDTLKKVAYETARLVIKLIDDFIDLCFSVGEVSYIEKEPLKEYARFVCDYRMQQLGFKDQFGIKENPLDWMDEITGNIFGNFFETTITQYSKSPLTGEWVY